MKCNIYFQLKRLLLTTEQHSTLFFFLFCPSQPLPKLFRSGLRFTTVVAFVLDMYSSRWSTDSVVPTLSIWPNLLIMPCFVILSRLLLPLLLMHHLLLGHSRLWAARFFSNNVFVTYTPYGDDYQQSTLFLIIVCDNMAMTAVL